MTPDDIAAELAPLGPPVMVFCASHSGSRLLARGLSELGVFMGARLNQSFDSLDLFDFVRWLVGLDDPGFERVLAGEAPDLRERTIGAMRAHLIGRPDGAPWGWKLPETANVLPVMTRLFPHARLIHLIRDGRDVAFSPFVAPKDPFWRRIYFGDPTLKSWRGLSMTQRAYRAHGHMFNAQRWVRSVTLGAAGADLARGRYLELRYERLAAEPAAELGRAAAFLGMPFRPQVASAIGTTTAAIGKWRLQPPKSLAEIRPILEPTLGRFGYAWEEGEVSAGSGAEPGGLGGLFRVRTRR